jgi:septum formation protein
VRPADVAERMTGDPRVVVEENAVAKASAVPGALVLGADTVVAVDGAILGKPRDEAQARAYLARLGGRSHTVHGGIAIVRDGTLSGTAVVSTQVEMRPLDDGLLDWYVGTGEWRGRAGGYAIQGRGAALVLGVAGDYLNVVGLPVSRLVELVPELLRSAG